MSPVTNDVEHLFVILISSLMKCQFKYFGFFFFLKFLLIYLTVLGLICSV